MCTLTKNSLARYQDIINFYKEIGANDFHTNPYVYDVDKPVQSQKLGVAPTEYATYFKNQFDYYLSLDNEQLNPDYIKFIMNYLTGIGGSKKCTHSGTCLTNFLNIDDIGNAAICPKFLGYEQMRLGNLNQMTINEILSPENPVMQRFLKQRLKSVNGCENDGCQYIPVCQSGCPYDSFLHGNDDSIEHRDLLCPGKYELYHHIDNRLKSFGVSTITSFQV